MKTLRFAPADGFGLSSIIHGYCFGNSADLLQDLQLASRRRQNIVQILSRTPFNLHFSWVRNILQNLPSSIGAKITPSGVRDIVSFRKSLSEQVQNILSSKASPDETPSIFTYLRDTPTLPTSEKSPQRLLDEATLLIMAGTYSPMLSLAVAHYHLIARPDILGKLRSELNAHPDIVDATRLEQLPYLSAIMQEAHRLTFGLTGRNPRVCRDETVFYTTESLADGSQPQTYRLPAGVSLSASTLLLHTNESLFPDPWWFDPERWLTHDTNILARRRRCMMSFLPGTRGCLGIHLANAEIAAAVSAMARWDMRLYETSLKDVSFLHDYHVMCPRLDSKGVRVEVIGRATR